MAATRSERRHLTLRISAKDLAIIDRLAKQHGRTRTDFMVRAYTGDLEDPYSLQEQLVSYESGLLRLERLNGVFR